MANFLSTVFWFFFLVALFLGWIALTSYNKLQRKSQAIKEQASNTAIAVSKKLSLINQLIDVVRNFQEGEQFTHLKIAQDTGNAGLMSAYQQSGMVLSSVQGVAQRFPELRASEQYHRLVDSIQHCEADIQQQREAYNANVKDYNSDCLAIPTVFVARLMGFGSAPYLEFDISGVQDVTAMKEFKTDDGERLQQLLGQAGSRIAGASRLVVDQAGQAGRLIASTVKDKVDAAKADAPPGAGTAAAQPGWFWMQPGGVPQGPLALADIVALATRQGQTDSVRVARAGTQDWLSIAEAMAPPEAPMAGSTAHG